MYNGAYLFNDIPRARKEYDMFIAKEAKASLCISCGACEEKCPQNLNIMEALAQTTKLFETNGA
jgi:predicted aldo/keto reductase-like oxidoreductase